MRLNTPLEAGAVHTVRISSWEDLSGNRMEENFEQTFTAIDPGVEHIIWQEEFAKAGGYKGRLLAVIDAPSAVALIVDAPIASSDVTSTTISVSRNGVAIPGAVEIVNPSQARQELPPESVAGMPEIPPYGFVVLWTPEDPQAYAAYPDHPLAFNVRVDLGGGGKSGAEYLVEHEGLGDIVWSDWFDSPLLSATEVGNDRFLHGRPFVKFIPGRVELYDHRARWYEPKTYRFIEPDPIGPVDSPNQYQAFGFDGLNVTDPSGLNSVEGVVRRRSELSAEREDAVMMEQMGGIVGLGRFAKNTLVGLVMLPAALANSQLEYQHHWAEAYNQGGIEAARAFEAHDQERIGRFFADLVTPFSGFVDEVYAGSLTDDPFKRGVHFGQGFASAAFDAAAIVSAGSWAANRLSGGLPALEGELGASGRGVGRGNQMPFANTAEDLVSAHTGVPLNRAGQTISGSGPGGVRIPDFPVRGPQSSIRLRGAVMEVKASHLKNFGDLSSRSRAQILDAVGYTRRLRGRSGMVRDPQIRAILENAHVEVFSDLAAPTRGRFYRLVEQGLIKWSPIPR